MTFLEANYMSIKGFEIYFTNYCRDFQIIDVFNFLF